jgi:hypothetical protein
MGQELRVIERKTIRAGATRTPPVHQGKRRGAMADTPVIEIRDLHKSYGNLEVLKGVDLVAPRGHVVSADRLFRVGQVHALALLQPA